MKAVLSRMLSIGAPIFVEEDDVEFSFAMEYGGPPVSYNLPRAAPIDIKRIPTAAVVAPASLSDRVSLPVVKPLLSSDPLKKKLSEDLTRGFEADVSPGSCNGSLRNRGVATAVPGIPGVMVWARFLIMAVISLVVFTSGYDGRFGTPSLAPS
ncbi:hypothetical protein NE237_020518 [Protea cynaroides]|uniref:Uncharacterized protein n=1 Tax=Protea cynaroides TaxID=273540 RepID=A0A9Q0H989_9MAGN|nr:hypothetical protein NE237_020518 [Protea cynaroides]